MLSRILLFAGFTFLIGTTACKKEFTIHATEDAATGKAFLKILHVAPDFRAVTGSQDTFNVLAGGVKVNGAALTYNAIYPVSGVNSYIAVEPGAKEIKLSVPGVLTGDSIGILSFSTALVASKYYTLVITDQIGSAGTDAGRILTEDDFPLPGTGSINIRFIHAVLNDTTGKQVDLYSAKHGVLAAGMAPAGISSFVAMPYNVNIKDTLYVTRTAATETPLSGRIVLATMALTTGNIATLSTERSYTVVFKGNIAATSGAKARALTGYVHY